MALGTEWITSTFSAGGQCVMARTAGTDGQFVEVGHSRGMSGVNFFTVEEWRAFIAGVKAGEFDLD